MALTKPQGNMMMKLAAEQASTSGTAIDFTGIPAGTSMIVAMWLAVSTNGGSGPRLQIGDSGGIEATGYVNSNIQLASSAVGSLTTSTAGFDSVALIAANVSTIKWILTLEDASDNTWVCTSQGLRESDDLRLGAGRKALSGTLDRVRLTTLTADTFDAGAISIAYF